MLNKLFTVFLLAFLLFCVARPGLCAEGAVGVTAPSQDINRSAAPTQTGGQTCRPLVMKLSPQDDYRGALDIRIHPDYGKLMPSADFLLIDPAGKKAGAVSGKTFTEFAASFADFEGLDDDETGEPGPSSGVIDIGNPSDGEYVLRLTGTEDGRYSIELNGYNKQPKRSHAEILDAPIKKGEVVEYRFRYSGTEAPAVVLKGK